MKIYKYFSAEVFDLVFAREGFCGVKCSTPEMYNDPYELFLGVDTNVSTEMLASYQELIQNLPQLPTTCFSRSPTVTPMWAHYASNHSGFVLEFDRDALEEAFQEASIADVSYKDAPDGVIQSALEMAAVTKKPRHTIWLQQTVMHEAYFSKQKSWEYEEECRLIDYNDYVEELSGNQILFIPLSCVSSVVVGRNFPKAKLDQTAEFALKNDVQWFREVIGKAHSRPYFVSDSGTTFVFRDGEIRPAESTCDSCGEPVPAGEGSCAWCAITEAQRIDAARGNPLRMLDSRGLLDNYLVGVSEIERRGRKRRREQKK